MRKYLCAVQTFIQFSRTKLENYLVIWRSGSHITAATCQNCTKNVSINTQETSIYSHEAFIIAEYETFLIAIDKGKRESGTPKKVIKMRSCYNL